MSKVMIERSLPRGKIKIPSSKSDAHRKIIASCLCFGQTSIIDNVDLSNDILATIEAMKHFADIEIVRNQLIIKSRNHLDKEASFNANESGSTIRFLIPLFSHFFQKTTIYGSKRLLERPLSIYQEIYKDGILISDKVLINKNLLPGEYVISGNVSSQFISGLLFVLPLLNGDSTIYITGQYESKSYVDLTIAVLKEFQIEIVELENAYQIKGNQKYQSINTIVEGDYSQLAFFSFLGLINSDVEVTNLNKKSMQGDMKLIEILRSLNANIIDTKDGYIFKKSQLKGNVIDLKDNPDLGPCLFAMALFCEGQTKFINTQRLKIKESDRILSMQDELLKFQVKMDVFDNQVIVDKQKIKTPKEILNSHNDHRIFMTLTVLSTLVEKAVIDDVQCVNKSYPKFLDDLFALGVKGEVYD